MSPKRACESQQTEFLPSQTMPTFQKTEEKHRKRKADFMMGFIRLQGKNDLDDITVAVKTRMDIVAPKTTKK